MSCDIWRYSEGFNIFAWGKDMSFGEDQKTDCGRQNNNLQRWPCPNPSYLSQQKGIFQIGWY